MRTVPSADSPSRHMQIIQLVTSQGNIRRGFFWNKEKKDFCYVVYKVAFYNMSIFLQSYNLYCKAFPLLDDKIQRTCEITWFKKWKYVGRLGTLEEDTVPLFSTQRLKIWAVSLENEAQNCIDKLRKATMSIRLPYYRIIDFGHHPAPNFLHIVWGMVKLNTELFFLSERGNAESNHYAETIPQSPHLHSDFDIYWYNIIIQKTKKEFIIFKHF